MLLTSFFVLPVFLDHLGIATVDLEFQQDQAAEYGVCEWKDVAEVEGVVVAGGGYSVCPQRVDPVCVSPYLHGSHEVHIGCGGGRQRNTKLRRKYAREDTNDTVLPSRHQSRQPSYLCLRNTYPTSLELGKTCRTY